MYLHKGGLVSFSSSLKGLPGSYYSPKTRNDKVAAALSPEVAISSRTHLLCYETVLKKNPINIFQMTFLSLLLCDYC